MSVHCCVPVIRCVQFRWKPMSRQSLKCDLLFHFDLNYPVLYWTFQIPATLFVVSLLITASHKQYNKSAIFSNAFVFKQKPNFTNRKSKWWLSNQMRFSFGVYVNFSSPTIYIDCVWVFFVFLFFRSSFWRCFCYYFGFVCNLVFVLSNSWAHCFECQRANRMKIHTKGALFNSTSLLWLWILHKKWGENLMCL